MRDNYLHYLKEKKKKKQVEEEKGRTYIETINELEKKSIENVNPYQKLLVRGALSSLVEAT